jgi:hypothetical protein
MSNREYTMTEPTKTMVVRASPISAPQKAIFLSQRSHLGRGGFRGVPVLVLAVDVPGALARVVVVRVVVWPVRLGGIEAGRPPPARWSLLKRFGGWVLSSTLWSLGSGVQVSLDGSLSAVVETNIIELDVSHRYNVMLS